MSVPLRSKDKVVGVLNLTDKKNDFFTDEDVKIATYIASQCAISIEKAPACMKTSGDQKISRW